MPSPSLSGWAGPLFRGGGWRRPAGLLPPTGQGSAASPEWVLPPLLLGAELLLQLPAPVGRVQWGFQKWTLPSSLGLRSMVSKVLFECLILGMNLTGNSTQAKALPQDSQHMEDTSRACIHSRR